MVDNLNHHASSGGGGGGNMGLPGSLPSSSLPFAPTSKLLGITSFAFAYSLLLSTYAMITLPKEAERMNPCSKTLTVATLIAFAGVTQLVGPFTGFLSDRSETAINGMWRGSKRTPYIVVGSVTCIAGVVVQKFAREALQLEMYAVAFVISNVALNVVSTAAYGLIPDTVPDEQTGQANGLNTLWSVVGNCTGFAFYFVRNDVGAMYLLYTLALLGTAVITCSSAGGSSTATATRKMQGVAGALAVDVNDGDFVDDGTPRLERAEEASNETFHAAAPLGIESPSASSLDLPSFGGTGLTGWTWQELKACYWISPSEHRDFFLVFVGRTCFYMGVSINAFLQYFFQDIYHLPPSGSLHDPARVTCVMAFVGQASGVLSAYPSGSLSDSWGRKPLIVLGTLGISVGYMILLFLRDPFSAFAVGAIIGVSNGAYQAVDLALAVDVLPNKESAARFLGVWGVGAMIGACLGPSMGGALLYGIGGGGGGGGGGGEGPGGCEGDVGGGNSLSGYVALISFGVISMCLGTAIILFVKKR